MSNDYAFWLLCLIFKVFLHVHCFTYIVSVYYTGHRYVVKHENCTGFFFGIAFIYILLPIQAACKIAFINKKQ